MKRCLSAFLMLMLLACIPAANAESGYELLEVNVIPAQLGERLLSDAEIGQLCNADLQTLRARISTYADYIAFVDQLPSPYYELLNSGENGLTEIGGEYSFAWMNSLFGGNMSAGLAYYLLQDNYPGMKTIYAGYYLHHKRDEKMVFGNLIPVADGYIVLGAENFAEKARLEKQELVSPKTALLHAERDIVALLQNEHPFSADNGELMHLFMIDSMETVQFQMDGDELYYPMTEDGVELLYEDRRVRIPKANTAPCRISMWASRSRQRPSTVSRMPWRSAI